MKSRDDRGVRQELRGTEESTREGEKEGMNVDRRQVGQEQPQEAGEKGKINKPGISELRQS